MYTSDHGQNFHERGEPGYHTHCSSTGTPSMEEGLVPMLTLTRNPFLRPMYETAAQKNHNRATHFNIFPTLLIAMGYDPTQVRKEYGIPLTDSLHEPFSFNVKFYARLGRKPQWIKIDLNRIIGPPSNSQ